MVPSFYMISGPVSSGKTEELLRRIKRQIIAQKNVLVFSPLIYNGQNGSYIESKNGLWHDAILVHQPNDILMHVKNKPCDVIAIDDLHLFDESIIFCMLQLLKDNKKIIGAGLDLDFKGEPFGFVPELFSYADKIDKLTAVCASCGNINATRTQRLINGHPPIEKNLNAYDEKQKNNETFEPRCINCFEPFLGKTHNQHRNLKLISFKSRA